MSAPADMTIITKTPRFGPRRDTIGRDPASVDRPDASVLVVDSPPSLPGQAVRPFDDFSKTLSRRARLSRPRAKPIIQEVRASAPQVRASYRPAIVGGGSSASIKRLSIVRSRSGAAACAVSTARRSVLA